ncbi:unnamed protein product [Cyclocybe aegerita]|uniref:FAD-binding FR-type domain-containing protein n=1 Tax=Cyclocybe aegerita TaxID=1973307 RepID=A0A8S0Y0V7_CYCAE|nr:unnamed protein product [Cyclocybe aegerita]
MSILQGWHRGERLVRQKLGYDKIPSTAYLYTSIQGDMPEQHSTFYSTRLPFLPACTLGPDGRPWGSILAGKDGDLAFISHPRYNTLTMEAKLWDGEPFLQNAKNHEEDVMLIAGIGVELSTRRRNKFAGYITKLKIEGGIANIELFVNEAIGNCPKYITLRELTPHPNTSPVVVNDKKDLAKEERLSEEAIQLILESDTVFFGTSYVASKQEEQAYPSHVGMNHRGGRPGFIRVKPSDGRTVILPDYSGNRIMTSLGNVEATPLASLTFISFVTGDILYLTGKARNVYGDEARSIMPLQDTFTEVFVTGYVHVRDAFPARQRPGYTIQPSPYSPPIRLLTEENPQSKIFSTSEQPKALLVSIKIHSPTLATFEWEVPTPVHIRPGQAAILGFMPLLGSRQYQYMAPQKPSAVNDDFIRTWTVSSAHEGEGGTRRFALTMREKPGGTVTGALFTIARRLAQLKPEALVDSSVLGLRVDLVGISGDFVLPTPAASGSRTSPSLLWVAGGIGITPFLSMLAALSNKKTVSRRRSPSCYRLANRRSCFCSSAIRSNQANVRVPRSRFTS